MPKYRTVNQLAERIIVIEPEVKFVAQLPSGEFVNCTKQIQYLARKMREHGYDRGIKVEN